MASRDAPGNQMAFKGLLLYYMLSIKPNEILRAELGWTFPSSAAGAGAINKDSAVRALPRSGRWRALVPAALHITDISSRAGSTSDYSYLPMIYCYFILR